VRTISALSLLLLLLSHNAFATIPIDESWIRVRIFENIKKVAVVGSRIQLVQQAESFRNVAIEPAGLKKMDIQFQKKWDRSLLVVKKENQPSLIKEGSLYIKGSDLKIGAHAVNDFLQISKRENGFDIIAYVKLRDYLKGVVSSEMPINWPAETLKAQIVAARSYVLFMSERRKKNSFDVESSIKDQVYRPTRDSGLEPLLDETANMVLFDENKNLFKAYYHSECGGQTSSAKKIFGDSQFDAEVRDPYCAGRTWRAEIPKREIEKYFGAFKQFVNEFNPLKRAYAVALQRPDSRVEPIDAQKLRLHLGSTRMKSTWFESHDKGDKIEFVGKGYGHGVGLCQWGSRQMGVMKKSFKEILAFYYPKSLLRVVKSQQLDF
jgi:stage II sporulation protein D